MPLIAVCQALISDIAIFGNIQQPQWVPLSVRCYLKDLCRIFLAERQ
jgi:hypothetical protein